MCERSPGRSGAASLGVVVALLAAACGPGGEERLQVFAASSLRDLLLEFDAARVAEGAEPVTFNFGASGELARQVALAPRADVFLSAGELEAGNVVREGYAEEASWTPLAANTLVVIVPSSSVVEPNAFEPVYLTSAERVSLANPAYVPAGRYARAWLEELELWDSVGPVAALATDVRGALTQVESGAAAFGVVYATDAGRSARVRVVHEAGPGATYVGVRASRSARADDATRFLAELQADAALFTRHGFTTVAPGAEDRTPADDSTPTDESRQEEDSE